MASSVAVSKPELIKEIISVYDQIQDIIAGPVVHISRAANLRTLRNRLNELKLAAQRIWGPNGDHRDLFR